MTVFKISGVVTQADYDGEIISVDKGVLEFVTRPGLKTLECTYSDTTSFAVSLSDYNLIYNGVHMNDGDLPDTIQLYDLVGPEGVAIRALNFVFTGNEIWEERLFSLDETPLSDLRTPGDASLFMALNEPVAITDPERMVIDLGAVAGVEVTGVLGVMPAHVEENDKMDEDQFDFSALGDATQDELAQAEFLADSAKNPLAEDAVDPLAGQVEIWEENLFTPETYLDDLGG